MVDKDRQPLQGVSEILYSWAIHSPIIETVLSELDKTRLEEQLYLFFCDNEEKRSVASIELYKLIWGHYRVFGQLPHIHFFQQAEYDRIFYSDYRDHTTHSLRTCLLGLYIFENNGFVRKSFKEYLQSKNLCPSSASFEDVFTSTWILTSLYHDIGYFFENNKIDQDNSFKQQVLDSITALTSTPLAHTPFFSSRISIEKEGYYINTNEIFTWKLTTIQAIADKNSFSSLFEASRRSKLASGKVNGLEAYYEFAQQTLPKGRPSSFRDHGISSALLLLLTWNSFKRYISRLCQNDIDNYYGECAKDIFELDKLLVDYNPVVIEAAQAIALHNINKKTWDINAAISKGLDLASFRIDFNSSENAMPFAFLLRLCDELQMWDRPRFRAPSLQDNNLHAHDIVITANNDGIFLRFPKNDEKYTHPESDEDGLFYKLTHELGQYLQQDTLSRLLKYSTRKDGGVLPTSPVVHDNKQSLNSRKIGKINKAELSDLTKIKDGPIEWLVGAVNLDEDIHFSSFYLFQSLSSSLPVDLKPYGYNRIVAIYDDFNETYYIPKEECISVSNRLIRKSIDDPSFLESVISNITERIQNLERVFDSINPLSFSNMSKEDLLGLYKKHNDVHRDLYTYARIPEALDRGVSTFTSYLKDYLKNRSVEFADNGKLNEAFEVLTYPENLSISGLEITELYELICQIKQRDDENHELTFSENNNRTLIKMDDSIKTAIEQYSSKWAFWGYHGYRNRVLRDFNYFVERLRVDIYSNRIMEQSKRLTTDLEIFTTKKYRYCSKYDIDSQHRNLFRLFSKIGTIKLYRRYVQLKNFYYLDMLLSAIAHQFSVKESVIRCMLPAEVEQLLAGNTSLLVKGKERNDAGIFALTINNGAYEFILGSNARQLYSDLKNATSHALSNSTRLQGDPISKGKVKGIGRVLRPSGKIAFERGDILVCVDSDPDCFDYIKIAGAVLAESGGLTCHAAIVCRELRIPCIVRIPGLLDSINDGDFIDVDADTGTINVETPITTDIISSLNLSSTIETEKLGRKASALIKLKREGINVPDFICIPISILQKLFSELEVDSKGAESQALISEIKNFTSSLNAPFFAIRSSTTAEDGVDFSGAGQEATHLHVAEVDVLTAIEGVLNEITKEGNRTIGGSIIVQRMIFGEYSGVLFSKHPFDESLREATVIETAMGGNEHLTSGRISPTRYIVLNGHVHDYQKGDKWGGECNESLIQKLEKTAHQIEDLFGAPQDIEWTTANNQLYILQSRNITGNKQIGASNIYTRVKEEKQTCIAIYQKYVLPIVLQNHLLRVAAVGKWIIDHWEDPNIVLDETLISVC